MSNSGKFGAALTVSSMLLLTITLSSWYTSERAECTKYVDAINDGYTVVYNGEDFTDIPYTDLKDKFNSNYVAAEKKIVLSPQTNSKRV